MKNLPGQVSSYNDVYDLNEKGSDGFYPVGKNNCWHSGIHIDLPSQNGIHPLSPLLRGCMVAYRISEELCELEYPQELELKDFEALNSEIKDFYEVYTSEESQEKAALQIYKLKDSSTVPVYKFSNNFALVKHNIPIPASNANNILTITEFDFFTLYTNLKPKNYYDFVQNHADFNSINQTLKEKTPFYLDWEFKVNTRHDAMKYSLGPRENIYPLSHFEAINSTCFHSNYESNTFLAQFENAPDDPFDIPVGDTDIINNDIYIEPINDNTSFYRMNSELLNGENQIEMGTLKTQTFRVVDSNYADNAWAKDNNYITIEFNGYKVKQTSISGWIDTTTSKRQQFSQNVYYTESETEQSRVLYTVEEINLYDTRPRVFKIVPLRSYLQQIYGSTSYHPTTQIIKDGNFITELPENIFTSNQPSFSSTDSVDNFVEASSSDFVIVFNSRYNLRDPENHVEYNESYSFYLNDVSLSVVKVNDYNFKKMTHFYDVTHTSFINRMNSSDIGIQLPTNIQEVDDKKLIGLKVKKDRDIFPEDWFKLIPNENQDLTTLTSKENLVYTQFYIQYSKTANWVVRADDFRLKQGKLGRLKGDLIQNVWPARNAGLMVYTDPGLDGSGKPMWNAKEILPVNTTFKLKQPRFLIHSSIVGFHALEGDDAGFIYITEPDHVSVKSIVNSDFKINDNIEQCSIPINPSTILGYGNIDKNSTQTQEISLFFKDSSILDNSDNLEINRYKISENTDIFMAEECEPEYLFFSPETQLEIIETKTIDDVTACKCNLKYISIHFLDSEIQQLVSTEDRTTAGIDASDTDIYYKIIDDPTKVWIHYFDFTQVAETGNLIVRPLAASIRNIWSDFKGKSFKKAFDGGGATTALHVDSPSLSTDISFWILNEQVVEHASIDNDNKLISFKHIGGNAELRKKGIPTYSTNPLYKIFTKIVRVAAWEGDLISEVGINSTMMGLDNGSEQKYIGLTVDSRICYLKEADANNCKDNLLDLKSYFTVSAEDANEDLFCDLPNEIINKIDTTPDGEETGDKIITSEELIGLYNNRNEPGYRDVIQSLRKLICKHPLEWNKDLYTNLKDEFKKREMDDSDDYINKLIAESEKLCIWSGIKNIDGIDDHKNLWFSHPVSMMKHLDEMKVLDNNPYLNKDITVGIDRWNFIKKARTQANISDSPGFAPLVYNNVYDNPTYYEGELLGCPTGLFNVPRGANWYRHQGIDLASFRENTPIISFIHGTVWACTWSGDYRRNSGSGYGKVMIIKSKTEGKIYLLAHLHTFLKSVGDEVVPGEEVALTGSTGWSTGEHLHLEVRLCDVDSRSNQILDEQNNKHPGSGGGLTWTPEYYQERPFGPPLVNPFDHSENYKDWKW